jgi:hypothetical protein
LGRLVGVAKEGREKKNSEEKRKFSAVCPTAEDVDSQITVGPPRLNYAKFKQKFASST